MAENTTINWIKENSPPRSFRFQLSQKLFGVLKRKGMWSADGTAEIGKRKLRFKSKGKANMQLTVLDASSEKELGVLNFYWKDFQRSTLKLASGSVFQFQSHNFFRGIWSWVRDGSSHNLVVFKVDNPLHRSGLIDYAPKDITAKERDILLLLGLQMQHYLNTWLLTIAFVVIVVVTSQ